MKFILFFLLLFFYSSLKASDVQINSIIVLENNIPKECGLNFKVLDKDKIVGIITDGDVRRILEKYDDPLNVPLSKIIKKAPMTVKHSLLAIDALQIMNDNKITNLVVTKKEKYLGMLHIHDIINAGL